MKIYNICIEILIMMAGVVRNPNHKKEKNRIPKGSPKWQN
jgi:hypothetical protein